MGKSSRIKKARKAEKVEKVAAAKKTFPSKLFIGIFVAALVIGMIVLKVNVYQQIEAKRVLAWDKDRILSSPEKSLKYAQVVLRELMTLIPEEVLDDSGNGYSGQVTIRAWIEAIVETKLSQQVGLIVQAKELALKGEPIELEWMPDRHVIPTEIPEKYKKMIEDRQRLHVRYVQDTQPEIVFAEALHIGRISRQRLLQDLKDTLKVAGEMKSDAEVAKINQERSKDFWWRVFLDKERPKIFGIEDRDIVALGTFIILINHEQVRSDTLSDLSSEFQYYWREQIILSNIISTLRQEGAHKAALVFGEDHMNTFPRLCKLWGVKLKIAGRA